MLKKGTSVFVRLIAFLLVFSLSVPAYASTAEAELVQPRASAYLETYGAYVYLPGNGQVQVYFDVTGTDDMDELGTLRIMLYESTDNVNWTWKKTFLHEDTPGMLIEDDFWYMNYVPYDGVTGRYYKAYVCIWAGKNGSGDTRYMWATSVRAT